MMVDKKPVPSLIEISSKLVGKVSFDFNQKQRSMKYFSSSNWFTQQKLRGIIPYGSDYKTHDRPRKSCETVNCCQATGQGRRRLIFPMKNRASILLHIL
jgi:hypothetical protein